MSAPVVGTWSQDVFLAFKSAVGAERRRLADILIRTNEPLIKTIVSQLTGRAEDGRAMKRATSASRMSCSDFREIEWDDAMSAGRIAFAKAIEKFDPAKGKITGYFAWKARYELQRMATFETCLARAPAGKQSERPGVDLVGEARDLELLTGDGLGGLVDVDDITPEDVGEWERTGAWPEDLASWRASRVPAPPLPVEPLPAPERGPLEAFLDTLHFRRAGRLPRAPLLMTWERFTLRRSVWYSPSVLVDALALRGVQTRRIRTPWCSSVEGFVGVEWASQPSA